MEFEQRKRHHIKHFEYSTGYTYFITVCLNDRRKLFGDIVEGEVHLSKAGQMIDRIWLGMPEHNPSMALDQYVVMPNHFHAIFGLINTDLGRGQCRAPTAEDLTLHDVVRKFKTLTTKLYGEGVRNSGWQPYSKQLWQRSYWDHVIRSDDDLEHHREYVYTNPRKWELDEMYPGSGSV